MPQTLSAYYEADKGFTLGVAVKYAAFFAIGVAIALWAVPSAADPAPLEAAILLTN
jgi:hypothetical protein